MVPATLKVIADSTVFTNTARKFTIANLALAFDGGDGAANPSAEQLGALLAQSAGTSVDATGMGTDRLNQLASLSAQISDNGITGAFTITAGVASNLDQLFGKIAVGADVTVDAQGMSDGTSAVASPVDDTLLAAGAAMRQRFG